MRVLRLSLLTALLLAPLLSAAGARTPLLPGSDPLTGPRSSLAKDWQGIRPVTPSIPILVLAGHADSQEMDGSGTSGAAVDLGGAAPMDPSMRDELYWNLLTARAVVELGRRSGLNIAFYEPPARTIAEADDPRTNWSVGRNHVAQGGYALEIHYDAYGPDGVGSGLIPPLRPWSRSRVDESLAAAFGPYPLGYRGGLGAPRRGIAILEIGKLEGPLEDSLRDPQRRQATIEAIAGRVVEALRAGVASPFSPPPDGVGSAPPGSSPRASSAAW
ncbi:hypothetical protein VB716_15755 [Synechococcus sp. CCY9201]|uniref:hypothetical protein n=1 Tax=unclassified Synechococcus TaxID=2626047 RepID=UPI002AD3D3B3|nr:MULTISPECIES: hypothetical protein [unclassified Synechococcus]MEA5422433.1 hypothetical protein [Synechococcus sp. CCY9202]MEA5475673.1 hypothetical protein [Synechococcus sp. CCY9201]CAK6701175.1 hypothetical protein IFHNHDMJ_03024 [Synechococcus sp. CBW1107]